MHTLQSAQQQLFQRQLPILANENVPLFEALGRVLAQEVIAPRAVPPQDNSAMDGYAVRCSEVLQQKALPVSQRVCAGMMPLPLAPNSVAQIFTGAPIPVGADAVVMQEHIQPDAKGWVHFNQPVRPGQNIRRAGEDMALGQVVLQAGCRLREADVGLLAALGMATVCVRRRLRVAVFFTGNELLEPGSSWEMGKIYNSNRYWLVLALQALGCTVKDFGIIPDELSATRQALRQAAAHADVVITCGGVSVGEEDHVKAAVAAEGILELWKIAIKPGKPLAYGQIGRAHFIGLPGNPVSAYVTFMVLIRDFLRACAGEQVVALPPLYAVAAFAWSRPDAKRTEFLRGRLRAGVGQSSTVELFPQQGSGVLTSCAWADVLIPVAPGQTIAPGDVVAIWRLP